MAPALPIFTDVVVPHPCLLPEAKRVLDTMYVVLSVPCARAPQSTLEAQRLLLGEIASCPWGRSASAKLSPEP